MFYISRAIEYIILFPLKDSVTNNKMQMLEKPFSRISRKCFFGKINDCHYLFQQFKISLTNTLFLRFIFHVN